MESNRSVTARKRRRVTKKRTAMRVCVGFIAFLCLLAATGILYVQSKLNLIDRSEITGNESLTFSDLYGDATYTDAEDSLDAIKNMQNSYEAAQKIPILQEDSIENFLLIGADRRSTDENGRSDSMIIVSINHKTGKIHLTSLMRAMYVCIPKSTGNEWGMLNAAYSWGGPKLLVQTIQNNFRIAINDYFIVDFSSFTDIINLVGGIDVELTKAEATLINYDCGTSFKAGVQHLNGDLALYYARIRHIDNDFIRTSRQRTVIVALLKKATSSSVSTLDSLANKILPLVNTNMSNGDIFSHLSQISSYAKYPIDQLMLPIENQDGTTFSGIMYVNKAEMYQVDFSTNIPALFEFILG